MWELALGGTIAAMAGYVGDWLKRRHSRKERYWEGRYEAYSGFLADVTGFLSAVGLDSAEAGDRYGKLMMSLGSLELWAPMDVYERAADVWQHAVDVFMLWESTQQQGKSIKSQWKGLGQLSGEVMRARERFAEAARADLDLPTLRAGAKSP